MPERQTVSACIITYNEAGHIAACLDSVRWADEIIVVDSRSTDATVEIARRYTGRVIVRDWPGHVAQKNFAAEQATGDWILALDADERVSPALRAEIETLLASSAADGPVGYAFPRRNFYLGRWWRRAGLYPDRKVRLWRRGRARWGGEDPHDHVIAAGPVALLRGDLLHYSFDSISDHVSRMNSYSSIVARTRQERGIAFRVADLIIRPPWRFVRMFLLQGGWRDGVAGLTLAAVESFYVFLKYAKIWERQHLPSSQPQGRAAAEAERRARSG